jgi:hypothetical protein
LSAVFCYLVLRSGSPAVAVAAWGLAGGISAVFGAIRLHLVPARPSVSIHWWRRETKRLGGFLTLASIAYTVGGKASCWASPLRSVSKHSASCERRRFSSARRA